jgi:DNA polymerase-3 subunit beta
MHLRIEKETILGVIDHVDGIVEKRNTMPILSNVLLHAHGDTLSVTATDLDITVRESVSGIDIEENGKTTVTASIFSALIRKMPSKCIIEMKVENGRMTIKGGRIRYQIPVLPADDFPLGKQTEGNEGTIQIDSVVRAFKLVKDSMSTEESRYYLNGAFIAIENDKLVAVSTDGHRLSIAQICDAIFERPDAIVPRKAVNELLKILSDFEGEMKVEIDERTITFEIGELLFTSKLIDGTFPDYTRVVPTDADMTLKVNPVELQQAIDRVSIVAAEKTSAVKLEIKGDKITITATDPQTGTATEEVAAESDVDLTVGYNGRYLREILSGYAGSEVVTISFSSETSPALIKPIGSDIDRSVLMPMRI